MKLGDLELDAFECSCLSLAASQHAANQRDSRYWDKDPAERERLEKRWTEISKALGPEWWP